MAYKFNKKFSPFLEKRKPYELVYLFDQLIAYRRQRQGIILTMTDVMLLNWLKDTIGDSKIGIFVSESKVEKWALSSFEVE